MDKLFFLDLETTGTNPEEHGIHQVAGIVEISGEVIETMSSDVRPFAEDKIDDKALEISGVSREDLLRYPAPQTVYDDMKRMFQRHINKYSRRDKFFFVGFNCHFDYSFLLKFFLKNGDPYFGSWCFWPVIDVAVLAAQYLGARRKDMQNFKQETVAELLGIKVEGTAHDALHDVLVAREIYGRVICRVP